MNIEDIIKRVDEARGLAEETTALMQRSEHPSISECGEAYVYANGAAHILEELERDLRSELLVGTTGFVTITDMAGNKTTVTC